MFFNKKRVQAFIIAVIMIFTAVVFVPAHGTQAAPEIGLRLHYTFDDGTAKDVSGSGRDGMMFGTLETSDNGVLGKSMLFKGGYIKMPDDIVSGLKDITVSVWIKSLDNKNNTRAWSIGSKPTDFFNLFAPVNGNIKYASALRINDSANRREVNGALEMNVWKHLVVTFTEAGTMLKIYEDGVQVASGSTGDRKISSLGTVTNAVIGRAQFAIDPDFYGYMDDFKVYDKALTANEIAQMTSLGINEILSTENIKNNIALEELNNITSLDGICDDLTLPNKIEQGTITWASSDTTVICNTGKINGTGSAKLNYLVTAKTGTISGSYDVKVVEKGSVVPDKIADIITTPGIKPALPSKITSNDGRRSISVTWDDIDPDSYAFDGQFNVTGKVTGENIAVSVKIVVDSTKLTNPIMSPGSAGGSPDPFVAFSDGWYYYVRHDFNVGITVSKAQRLQDIEAAPRVTVYTAPASGMYSKEYWAPELHFVDGNWYIYVAADDGNNANHRMYVLECSDPKNPQASYTMKGKIAPTKYNSSSDEWEIDPQQDKWAIDGTVLQAKNGKNYFIWSGWEGNTDGRQDLYIAEMLNPWTIKGDRTLIAKPEERWELKGADDANANSLKVLEGPQIIQRNGIAYIVYSACHSALDWYCLGMLTADDLTNTDLDLTDASLWTKYDGPLFTKSLNPQDQVYGTGHAMITTSPDGSELWLLYHAFQKTGGNWQDRSARIQKMSWNNNIPVFGNPVPFGEIIDQPSGTSYVTAGKYQAEEAVLSGGASVAERSRASGGKAVIGLKGDAKLTFNINVPVSGNYLLTLQGNSSNKSGTNITNKILTVNSADYSVGFMGTDSIKDIWLPSYDITAPRKGEGLTVFLKKGENTVVLSQNADDPGEAEVDYLYLVLEEDLTEDTPVILTDTQTGITVSGSNGILLEGYKLLVSKISSGDKFDQITNLVNADSALAGFDGIYDIKIVDASDDPVTLEGKVKVEIPNSLIKTENKVFELSNGILKPLDMEYANDIYSYETASFEILVIANEASAEPTTNPTTVPTETPSTETPSTSPENTNTPAPSSSQGNDPITGDTVNAGFVLLLISLCSLCAVLYLRKKRV